MRFGERILTLLHLSGLCRQPPPHPSAQPVISKSLWISKQKHPIESDNISPHLVINLSTGSITSIGIWLGGMPPTFSLLGLVCPQAQGRSALATNFSGQSFGLSWGCSSQTFPPPLAVLVPEISFPFTLDNTQSAPPTDSPLGYILKALGLTDLRPKCLIFLIQTG